MKTHPLVENEKECDGIVLSLLRQVGSCHDNIAFADPIPSELANPDNNIHPPISTVDRNNTPLISISFYEINYHVGKKPRRRIFRCCKPKPRKQLLHNITGGFSPGMNAILGKYRTCFFSQSIEYFHRSIGMWKIISIRYSC
jgi:hypothetical protein